MLYCPFCCGTVGAPEGVNIPHVQLPFARCDIIFNDKPMSATGVQAKVLAPSQVRLIDLHANEQVEQQRLRCGVGCHDAGHADGDVATVREIPEYLPGTAVVLFPDDSSTLCDDACEKLRDLTVVVIDTTWQRALSVRLHPRLAQLPSIRLSNPPPSWFWRYHSEGAGCVSTIEALAALSSDLQGVRTHDPFKDPLLFFFVRQFALITLRKRDGELPMEQSEKERRAACRRQRAAPARQRLVPLRQVTAPSEAKASGKTGDRPSGAQKKKLRREAAQTLMSRAHERSLPSMGLASRSVLEGEVLRESCDETFEGSMEPKSVVTVRKALEGETSGSEETGATNVRRKTRESASVVPSTIWWVRHVCLVVPVALVDQNHAESATDPTWTPGPCALPSLQAPSGLAFGVPLRPFAHLDDVEDEVQRGFSKLVCSSSVDRCCPASRQCRPVVAVSPTSRWPP